MSKNTQKTVKCKETGKNNQKNRKIVKNAVKQ